MSLTRREQIALVLCAIIGFASAAGLVFLIIGRYTKAVPARGGEHTEGIVGQPKAVNPILASDDPDAALVRLLFANLSQLAEKIDPDHTGRTWNVRLKEGLVWSDGAKLTSDDVIFTVEKIQDPQSQSPSFASWQGIIAHRVSELEVQFTLVAPYPFFSEYLKRLAIVPKHIFAETPVANWRLSDYLLKPVGSGPYLFASYDKKSNGFITRYRLTANPHSPEREPYLDAITFAFFPNEKELIDAVNAGSVDGFGTFSPELLPQVTRPYTLTEFTLPSYYAVFLNQSQNFALKDGMVRTALDASIDRPALVARVLEAHGDAVYSPVALADTIPTPTGMQEAAMRALDTAGWKVGEGGVREKKIKGAAVRLEFTLTVPQVPFLTRTAEILRDTWYTIGAHVTLRILPPADIASTAIRTRDYQALLFGNVVNPPGDLYPFWDSQERFYPGLNLALYASASADKLMEGIRRTADPSVRAKNLAALRDIIHNDMPAVLLYSPHYLVLTRRDMKGVQPALITEPADRFFDAPSWYVNTSRAVQ